MSYDDQIEVNTPSEDEIVSGCESDEINPFEIHFETVINNVKIVQKGPKNNPCIAQKQYQHWYISGYQQYPFRLDYYWVINFMVITIILLVQFYYSILSLGIQMAYMYALLVVVYTC